MTNATSKKPFWKKKRFYIPVAVLTAVTFIGHFSSPQPETTQAAISSVPSAKASAKAVTAPVVKASPKPVVTTPPAKKKLTAEQVIRGKHMSCTDLKLLNDGTDFNIRAGRMTMPPGSIGAGYKTFDVQDAVISVAVDKGCDWAWN